MPLIGYQISSGAVTLREFDGEKCRYIDRDTVLHKIVLMGEKEPRASFEDESAAKRLLDFLNSLSPAEARTVLEAIGKSAVSRHANNRQYFQEPSRWSGRHQFGG